MFNTLSNLWLIQVQLKIGVKSNEIPFRFRIRPEPNQQEEGEVGWLRWLGRRPAADRRSRSARHARSHSEPKPPGDRGPDIPRGWQGSKCARAPRVAV